VTLYEWTRLGNRVRVHSGSVIGADGFGYAPRKEGGKVTGHHKIHHLGRVVIGDDVELGANVTIDRGTVGDTRIGSHVKIDNQVQIGHNCQVGEGSVLCGMSGMAGSSKVGKYVYIGGQSGLANQVTVGDGARVAATTGVYTDVAPGMLVMGHPMREQKAHFRVHALLDRMLEERRKNRGKPEKG
jgi:UDP-3-O-[3-hydroxymyristoyl] glucosamine N-acyltransferase